MIIKLKKKSKVVAWWSGGVTSAVTCKLCIDFFGVDNCEFIFIDTNNEHEDTERFRIDCEKWYNKEIKIISNIGIEYKNIQEVWRRHKSLNVATGAICSTMLKRRVREVWQKTNNFKHQAFGFEFSEYKRALSLVANHAKAKPIFPLIMMGYEKEDCINIIKEANIKAPMMYELGFNNNNCFSTGCVQGGIGYWQKIKREFPEKFNVMAAMEHELTNNKDEPVTMLKDQSAEAKRTGDFQVFLKPHKDFPNLKDISMMKGREPKPLLECNGFCGTNDFTPPTETSKEINYDN